MQPTDDISVQSGRRDGYATSVYGHGNSGTM